MLHVTLVTIVLVEPLSRLLVALEQLQALRINHQPLHARHASRENLQGWVIRRVSYALLVMLAHQRQQIRRHNVQMVFIVLVVKAAVQTVQRDIIALTAQRNQQNVLEEHMRVVSIIWDAPYARQVVHALIRRKIRFRVNLDIMQHQDQHHAQHVVQDTHAHKGCKTKRRLVQLETGQLLGRLHVKRALQVTFVHQPQQLQSHAVLDHMLRMKIQQLAQYVLLVINV